MALPPWVWGIVDLFFTVRRFSSPLGGRPLPCPGSPAEQPAALLDAFAILETMEPARE